MLHGILRLRIVTAAMPSLPRFGANQTFEIEMTVQINGQIGGKPYNLPSVKEEVVDDSEELRYFDLPLIIKIEEIVTPNNIVLQQKTSTSAFLPSQTKSIEYLVKNNNNIPLDIVITASAPSGWDVKMKTSNVQLGANFVILTVPAFSQDEFTMDFTSPDSMRTGEELTVEFEVTPMDEEVPYPLEFKQEERFKFATTCDGFVNCVSSQVLNPSTPTIGLYFGLGLVLFIAIYRKKVLNQHQERLFGKKKLKRLILKKKKNHLTYHLQ